MRYDAEQPIAVFLGPSLPLADASELLGANYYPPVRMGDLYRLLATGVQTIVIIDGVFHESTPVWQREILAALDLGITVVGASSMGALRAAELAPHGMVGLGTIYGWYRDGVIDGDDEVALLHANHEFNYRAASEPLVNIRFNLARAAERGLLEEHLAAGLVAEQKARYFAQRTRAAVLQSASLAALPAARAALRELFERDWQDLKRRDALEALRFCAARRPAPGPSDPMLPRASTPTAFPAIRGMRQGILSTDGALTEAETVVQAASEDTGVTQAAWETCVPEFFLAEWAAELGLVVSEPESASLVADWHAAHPDIELPLLGLTSSELGESLARRRLLEQLLESPDIPGIDTDELERGIDAVAAAFARTGAPSDLAPRHERAREARRCAHLAAFAAFRGFECPAERIDQFLSRWEARIGLADMPGWLADVDLDPDTYRQLWGHRATYEWMIEKGPVYFGYFTWSFPLAMLRELQLGGELGRWVARAQAREATHV